MSTANIFESLDFLIKPVSENITASWTAVTVAINSAESLLSKQGQVSAAEYEKFGRQISDLAAEYSRGLSNLAEGIGNVVERRAILDIASSIGDSIDNLREAGAEAYAKYGKGVIEAAESARIANLAAVGGSVVDLAEFSFAVMELKSTGDWNKLGATSAGILGATALGELGALGVGILAGIAGATGTPVVVAAFLVAGGLAYVGSHYGGDIFNFISDKVNNFFNQALVWRYYDPLAIDLDGDGIETISVNESTRVLFDLDGDGLRAGTGWLNGDDGWLVLDRNGNGRIDNGGELFGVDTILPNGQKASSGFAALAASDSNYDKVFDAADADFSRAQIWQDFNQNGISDAGELKSLSAAGIASISLASVDGSIQLRGGNFQTASASFTRNDGSTGKVANLNLVTNAFFREFSSKIPATFEASLLPDVRGSGMVRDFREAASLNPELIRDVNSLKGLTRAEALRQVDQLLIDWAATSDFKTSKELVEALGMKLLFRFRGMTDQEMKAVQLIGQQGQAKEAVLTQLKVSGERYDALRVQEADMSRMLDVLEAFNGQNYLDIPEARLRSMAAADKSGTSPVFVENSLTRPNQAPLLMQAYSALRGSVYDAFALQTRLKPYIDTVKVSFGATGITFNFTALDAKFEQQYLSNPVQAFIDCFDLETIAGNLSKAGWQGREKLSHWASELAAKGQLDAVNAELASAFATNNEGLPKVKAGTNSPDSILPDANDTLQELKRYLLLGLDGNDYLMGNQADDILDGGNGNDNLNGGDGNDLLLGQDGADSLYGQGGNDALNGGAGNDFLSGGSGNDVYSFGRGSGQDRLDNTDWGTSKVDAIQLGSDIAVSDVQLVRRGDDLVLSLAGTSDSVTVSAYFLSDAAGPYRLEEIRFVDGTVWTIDTVKARVQQPTNGHDILTGYAVADTIRGGDGNDSISGNAGDDLLHGDAGADTLNGEAGADSLVGGDANDNLNGGDGNDSLLGQDGADILYGGSGDDTLDGGASSDFLSGGSGNDVYSFGRGSGQDRLDNLDWGTSKVDAIQLGSDIAVSDVQLLRRDDDLVLSLVGTSDSVTVSAYFQSDAAGPYRLEEIRFADGAVWSIDTVKARVHQPTSGNDRLIGYAVADTIRGGDGNDNINGNAGDDLLYGDAGNDTVYGGSGADRLDGGDGADTLYGDSGDDTLNGGAGSDFLSGGSGNDVYSFGRGSGQDRLDNTDWGTSKVDAIQLGSDIAVSDVQLLRRDDDLVLSLAGTSDSVTVSAYFQSDAAGLYRLEEIRFADGTVWSIDTVKARVQQPTSGNDRLIGYAVADTIRGGDGNDFISGNAGDDLLHGDAGADTLNGDAGADRLVGGDGNDNLNGGDGNDLLLGQDGADSLYGGSGEDTLDGGASSDFLSGGSGNDVYSFGRGSGQDRLDNMDWGTSKIDAIQLGSDIAVSDVQLLRRDDDLVLSLAGTSDSVTVIAYFQSDAAGPYRLEEIRFADGTVWSIDTVKARVQQPTSGNDRLIGYAVADTIRGGDGNDNINGNAGDDLLYGDAGNDTVYGGSGADSLNGGDGGDNLNGGDGNDVLLGQDGADYLYGDAGNDILRGGFDNDYLSDRAGAGLLDGGAGNDTLYAGTGVDIIIGGVGNDLYSTGAGNDLILFNKGDGFDILDRGDGGRDILSLGGGLSYSDLRFSKASTDLVLQTGASDQITFRDWYASVPSRSVATLQVIIQPSSDNTSAGSDLTRGHKVESFDFSALVGAFDSARAANASLTSWTLSDALNTCRLAVSDTAAFGGDIAYQYGLLGTVDLVGTAKTFGLLSDPALGSLVRDFIA